MKTLICIAPDGKFVCEGEFETIEQAWDRSRDMGSRWFFYPIHLVCGSKSLRSRIADVPDGMPEEWKGKTLGKLLKCISSDTEHSCEYANGQTPFCIYPHPLTTNQNPPYAI